MDAKRIVEIVQTLSRAKARGAILKGRSVIEKELQAWIDEPPIQLTEKSLGIIGKIPVPYEQEYLDIA